MTLSQVKALLPTLGNVQFQLENGAFVPEHFHVTEIEVEYQSDTIGKYALDFDGANFILKNKTTACLASDKCGIPGEKQKVSLSELTSKRSACCTPNSGCC